MSVMTAVLVALWVLSMAGAYELGRRRHARAVDRAVGAFGAACRLEPIAGCCVVGESVTVRR